MLCHWYLVFIILFALVTGLLIKHSINSQNPEYYRFGFLVCDNKPFMESTSHMASKLSFLGSNVTKLCNFKSSR